MRRPSLLHTDRTLHRYHLKYSLKNEHFQDELFLDTVLTVYHDLNDYLVSHHFS